jgi:hypothetical protein
MIPGHPYTDEHGRRFLVLEIVHDSQGAKAILLRQDRKPREQFRVVRRIEASA